MNTKMMKAVLSAGLVMSMVAGCSSDKGGSTAGNTTGLSGSVSTNGSTSMEKVIGGLGESFMAENPDVTFTYNPTGSGSGIEAAKAGTCDIGLSSRYLKDEEKAAGLKETVMAIDGIAVIVNTANSVNTLTVDQIASIYKGEIRNWSEVGGSDGEIVVIGREAGSGTRDGFESITKTTDECKLKQELTSTGDVITNVKSNENAIGYASLASVDESVQTIAVNGVLPSSATIRDGSYAIQRPFVMVTVEGKELSATAKAFFDYALSADSIIEAAGLVVPAK